MAVTRAQGYARGRGKEEAGLALAEDFLRRLMGHRSPAIERVTDPEDNYLRGDLRLATGHYIEVKRQPIDPGRYRRNFVEVAEITSGNPKHASGFADLAALLNVGEARLAQVRVQDKSGNRHPDGALGRQPSLSLSIRSLFSADATMYVNPDAGHVYVYPRAELAPLVTAEVLSVGVKRGAGMSNEDTLGVLVDLPTWLFHRNDDGLWVAGRAGAARAVRDLLAA